MVFFNAHREAVGEQLQLPAVLRERFELLFRLLLPRVERFFLLRDGLAPLCRRRLARRGRGRKAERSQELLHLVAVAPEADNEHARLVLQDAHNLRGDGKRLRPALENGLRPLAGKRPGKDGRGLCSPLPQRYIERRPRRERFLLRFEADAGGADLLALLRGGAHALGKPHRLRALCAEVHKLLLRQRFSSRERREQRLLLRDGVLQKLQRLLRKPELLLER